MLLTVNFEPTTGVVEASVSGVVSSEDLREIAAQIFACGQENDASLFVADYRRATVEFSPFDVFEVPQFQLELGLDRSSRFAVVSPRHDRGRQLAHFYTVVSSNRGWTAAMFDTRQEALDWLLE